MHLEYHVLYASEAVVITFCCPACYMFFMEREAGYYNETSVTYLSIMEYQLKNALVRRIKYN
jgi:hypothetical protein